MPFAAYADLGWLIRAVRVLPVVAVAATVGGIIGGFTIFAIDSALTWQPRPDLRADSQATERQTTRPVRIVGGAIPDPSAGMSAPPPAQPRATSAAPQVPAQLLTPKPLGPAQFKPQAETKTQVQAAPAAAQPVPNPALNATATQQQSTRWPDALSRSRQGSGGAKQQTEAPQPNATPERSASKNSEVDRKPGANDRAAAYDEDRTASSRRDRHGRWRTMMMSDMPRSGAGDDADMSPARGARRLDARAYNRIYNSNSRAGEDDQERAAVSRPSRQRRFGSDERYYGRSGTIVREQPDEANQEATRPRAEPFWGGGSIRQNDRVGGSQNEGD
jgi:hypothetical protein